jgi:hypothetical protein
VALVLLYSWTSSLLMLRKFLAVSLFLLGLSPFTAPFSTCDLATLLEPSSTQTAPFAPPSHAAIAAHASALSVPTLASTARVKLLARHTGRRLSYIALTPLAASSRPAAAVVPLHDRLPLSTILRV